MRSRAPFSSNGQAISHVGCRVTSIDQVVYEHIMITGSSALDCIRNKSVRTCHRHRQRLTDQLRRAVDEFWLYKDQVYRHVINSRVGVLADFACQFFMRRHLDEVTPEDYFVTEAYIFRKLRGLRDLLTSRSFEAQILSQFSEIDSMG